jgi:hypothetical protein
VSESERRLKRRYSIALSLRFIAFPSTTYPAVEGEGQTANISSSGILFLCTTAPPAGAYITMNLDWPAVQGAAMQLILGGRVVWCHPPYVAAEVSRHKFVGPSQVEEPKREPEALAPLCEVSSRRWRRHHVHAVTGSR